MGTLALAVAASAAAAPAVYAGEPTTGECLISYENSLGLNDAHKLRAAKAQLLICSSASCPADVRTECIQRVVKIDAAMPTIVFEAKDADGTDLSDVTVKVDGELLAERIDGTALALDPGVHAFQLQMADQPVIEKQLVILEGQKDRRELVVFNGVGVRPSPPPTLPSSPPPLVTSPGPPAVGAALGSAPDHAPGRRARTAAVVVAAAAVVALGVGATEGVVAWQRKNAANHVCPDTCPSGSYGATKWSSASSAGSWSTAFFVTGGVLAAGGVTLWKVVGRAPGASVAQVGVAPSGIALSGQW